MSGSIPKSLANCTQLAEFNIEGNSVSALPDGLLSSLGNLSYITLSRNQFSAFPAGGNLIKLTLWTINDFCNF